MAMRCGGWKQRGGLVGGTMRDIFQPKHEPARKSKLLKW